jgi:hypothetical protein
MSDELVQVWEQRDGTWRWRYVVLDHTELRSNRVYGSATEAVVSAREAYPGVPVLGPVDLAPASNGGRRAGVVRIAVASAVVSVAVLAAWYRFRRLRGGVRRGR